MASASEAELALLSGAELVVHLRDTYRRADFEAVARVLDERDRRNAKVEAALEAALADVDAANLRERGVADAKAALGAALADFDALRKKYEALLDAHRRPRDEAADEMALLVGVATPDMPHQDEPRLEEGEVKGANFIDLCSDEEEEEEGTAVGPCKADEDSDKDEEDTELLSQRWKRLRRGEPGAMESGKGDGQGQNNSVGTLGSDQQRSSSARMEGPVARTGQIVGTPEDLKVAAFVQRRGIVKPEKFGGEMPRTMLLPSQGFHDRSALQKGSSKNDHVRARIGEKEGSSDGVPARGISQPPKGKAKMAKCGNKEVGADMQKCPSLVRQNEERRITREEVQFEPYNGKSTPVQVKRETNSLPSTITRHWESEGHMISSFLENNNIELCMQALCALYRQGKLTIENTALRKSFDAFRATKLAEFLLDGDLEGPLIRTAEELENHDATDSFLLQQITIDCSGQLFNIFRNKEDPYFC